MERGPVAEALEGEHRWVDERLGRFRALLAGGVVDAAPFREAAAVLHRHIYLEEEVLFPELEVRGLRDPIAVMAGEHGRICNLLGQVERQAAGDAEPGSIGESMGELARLLGEHNLKEERVLYPAADRLLAGEVAALVVERLRGERAPEGWACRAHRG